MCFSALLSSAWIISIHSFVKLFFHDRCQSVSFPHQGSQLRFPLCAQWLILIFLHLAISTEPHNWHNLFAPLVASSFSPFTSAYFILSFGSLYTHNAKVSCAAKKLAATPPLGFSASSESFGSAHPCRRWPKEMRTIFIFQFLESFGDLVLPLRSLHGVLLPYSRTRRHGCMGTLITIREQKVALFLRTCFTFSAFYPLDGPIA